jgi:hypothetical protein
LTVGFIISMGRHVQAKTPLLAVKPRKLAGRIDVGRNTAGENL